MTAILRTDHHLVEVNDDGSVVEYRTGERGRTYANLQEYYMSINSPIQRWVTHCQTILSSGGTILDTLAQITRFVPHVLSAIEATNDGELVANTPWTKEQCIRLLALAQAVEAFTIADIDNLGSTPKDEISKYA